MCQKVIPRLGALILAAGASSRLGQIKQLVSYRGKPLLLRVVEMISPQVDTPPLVVLGANAEEVAAVLPATIPVCYNPDWPVGMRSSICCGVSNLQYESDGLLLVTVDQWLIQPDDIGSLVRLWKQNPEQAVAARYADTSRIPVIFPKSAFPLLLKGGSGDGAAAVLQAMSPLAIEMPRAEFDLDTPGDMLELRGREYA